MGANRLIASGMRYPGKDVLERFFNPRSIAIVGASASPGRAGYTIVHNLIKWGFPGRIYPVNPRAGDVLGWKAYPTITDIPDEVDLVVTLAPATGTLRVIEECGRKGVKALSIVSGGFSESGSDGAWLEKRVVVAARRHGIRVAGPNCIGPVNPSARLMLSFYHPAILQQGGVALIAQSGLFCAPVMEWMASALRLGISKSIDLGNKCDIDEADVLDYLVDDPDTRAVALHIEGIKDGGKFLKAAARVARVRPVVVFKSGRTQVGARATASHTGAVANDDVVFDAAARQAGLIRARDLDEFLDLAKAFSCLSAPRGNRIGIVTYSGGVGAMAADACADFDLELATFSPQMAVRLRHLIPSTHIRIGNPLDLFAVAPPANYSEDCLKALECMVQEEGVDSVLLCLMVSRLAWQHDMAVVARMAEVVRVKPAVGWVIGEKGIVEETTRVLEEHGMPTYPSPERAVRALARCASLRSVH